MNKDIRTGSRQHYVRVSWLSLGIILLLATSLLPQGALAQATPQRVYVNANATGSNTGTSWENAYVTVAAERTP